MGRNCQILGCWGGRQSWGPGGLGAWLQLAQRHLWTFLPPCVERQDACSLMGTTGSAARAGGHGPGRLVVRL